MVSDELPRCLPRTLVWQCLFFTVPSSAVIGSLQHSHPLHSYPKLLWASFSFHPWVLGQHTFKDGANLPSFTSSCMTGKECLILILKRLFFFLNPSVLLWWSSLLPTLSGPYRDGVGFKKPFQRVPFWLCALSTRQTHPDPRRCYFLPNTIKYTSSSHNDTQRLLISEHVPWLGDSSSRNSCLWGFMRSSWNDHRPDYSRLYQNQASTSA